MSSFSPLLGRVALVIVGVQLVVGLLAALLCWPPTAFLANQPLSLRPPYAHLTHERLHEMYADEATRAAVFGGHRDSFVDWTGASAMTIPHWLYHLVVERGAQMVEIDAPARIIPPPLHLMHVMQGPARMQVLRAIVLLGIPNLLADRVLSLADLFTAVRANETQQAKTMREGLLLAKDEPLPAFSSMPIGKLERLMHYALTFGYFAEVAYTGSHLYVHNAQSAILRDDHPNNMNHLLFHFSNEAYLGWHRLFEAILAPEDPGSLPAEAELFGGLALDATFGGERATSRAKQALAEHERVKAEHLARLREQLGNKAPAASEAVQHPTAWNRALKDNMWDFYQSRPALQRNFQQAMSNIDSNVHRALLADYDWGTLTVASGETSSSVSVSTLVDVGGAEGSFLARLLHSNPTIPHGMLFDLASNIRAAQPLWSAQADPHSMRGQLTREPGRRIQLVPGDFFQPNTIPLPVSTEAPTKYVLRQILHDWSDSETIKILHNFKQRLNGYTQVALVLVEANRPASEGLLSFASSSSSSASSGVDSRRLPGAYPVSRPSAVRSLIDGQMLVCCNARERAPEQWRALFQVTGWKLVRHVQTRSVFSIMELQPEEEEEAPATEDARTSTAADAQKEEL